ncbi:MAG: serine protease [Thermoguttaceae bacterium]
MESQLYIRIRGRVLGPYDQQTLKLLAQRGQFSRIHEVSRDGVNWFPAYESWKSFIGQRDGEPETAVSTPRSPDAATVPPQPQGIRSRRWALSVIAVGIVGIAVASLAVTSFLMMRGDTDEGHGALAERDATTKMPEQQPTPAKKASTATLTSIKDHKGIADAIGMVAVGGIITNYEGRRLEVPVCRGSAFAITADGAMLTNKHVIEPYINLQRAQQLKEDLKAEEKLTIEGWIWVFVNGDKYNATLTHVSAKNDYAILRVDHHFTRPFRLKEAASEELQDVEVRAIGFPGAATKAFSDREWMLKQSNKTSWHEDIAECFANRELRYVLTSGRISKVDEDAALKVTWLQHNAGTAHGSSGGPLVLTDATVLGVNTQGHRDETGTGIEFSCAFFLGQCRKDIDEHVHGVVWVP